MAEASARKSIVPAIVAMLSGPLAASVVAFLTIQIFFNPTALVYPAAPLVLALLVTLVFGPLVHGVLRKLNWVKWFQYAAASAVVATGVAVAISVRIGEWSVLISLFLVLFGIATAVVSWWILRLDRERAERHRRNWIGALAAVVAVNAALIAFNPFQVVLAAAIITTDRPPAPPEDPRHWAKATIAPAEFKFWSEDAAAISLPAEREAFLEYVRTRGGTYWIPGEGIAEAMRDPPSPYPDSPCSETPDGIVVHLDSRDPREGPKFIAYVSDGKVVCIDPQFQYAIPGLF
ncbi:MAG: hypothetical protein ABMA14_06445 [Hyphomonadaceae bacterium]